MSALSTGAVAGIAASSAILFVIIVAFFLWLWRQYAYRPPRRFTMLGGDEFAHNKNETEAGYEFKDRRYSPSSNKSKPDIRVSEQEAEEEEEKSIGGGNFSLSKEFDGPGRGRGGVTFEERVGRNERKGNRHDKKATQQTMIDARKSTLPTRSSHQFIHFDVSPPLTPLSPTFSSTLSPTKEDFSPTTPTFASFPPTPTSPSFPLTISTSKPLLATRSQTEPLLHTHTLASPDPVVQIGTPPAAYAPSRIQTTTTKYGNYGPGVMGIGGVEGAGGNGKLEGDGGKRESFKGARSGWKS
ncbi:hypothetical protein BDZ45DRAFT_672518 [Acephala macrosclerotiorum]|nr:hypothetical protein BDZ45DRAFT_672518 [Acephala macrosclerotiorum]